MTAQPWAACVMPIVMGCTRNGETKEPLNKSSAAEWQIESSIRAVSKAGNTYSIPPLSELSAEPKSLAISSCRFNQSFLRYHALAVFYQRIHVTLIKRKERCTPVTKKGRTIMEKLLTRKEAARILGISVTTLDAARAEGLISYVQYVSNGCVYFTEVGLQEYIARCTYRAKPRENTPTYRKPRSASSL